MIVAACSPFKAIAGKDALMLSSIFVLVQAYAPTNVAVRWFRERPAWCVPAMLLGVGYLWMAATCTVMLERGGTGWLNLLVALFVWNGLKFLIVGPVSLFYTPLRRWRGRRGTPRSSKRRHEAEPPRPTPLRWARGFGIFPELQDATEPAKHSEEAHVPGSSFRCRMGACNFCNGIAQQSR